MKNNKLISMALTVLATASATTPAAAQFVIDVTSPATLQFQMPNYGATPLQFGGFQPHSGAGFQPSPFVLLQAPQPSIFQSSGFGSTWGGFGQPQFRPVEPATVTRVAPVGTYQPSYQSRGFVNNEVTIGPEITWGGRDNVVIGEPAASLSASQNGGWIWPSEPVTSGFNQNQPQPNTRDPIVAPPRVLYSAGCQSSSGALSSLGAFLDAFKNGASCDVSLRLQNY
jgi:hypothetical protein